MTKALPSPVPRIPDFDVFTESNILVKSQVPYSATTVLTGGDNGVTYIRSINRIGFIDMASSPPSFAWQLTLTDFCRGIWAGDASLGTLYVSSGKHIYSCSITGTWSCSISVTYALNPENIVRADGSWWSAGFNGLFRDGVQISGASYPNLAYDGSSATFYTMEQFSPIVYAWSTTNTDPVADNARTVLADLTTPIPRASDHCLVVGNGGLYVTGRDMDFNSFIVEVTNGGTYSVVKSLGDTREAPNCAMSPTGMPSSNDILYVVGSGNGGSSLFYQWDPATGDLSDLAASLEILNTLVYDEDSKAFFAVHAGEGSSPGEIRNLVLHQEVSDPNYSWTSLFTFDALIFRRSISLSAPSRRIIASSYGLNVASIDPDSTPTPIVTPLNTGQQYSITAWVEDPLKDEFYSIDSSASTISRWDSSLTEIESVVALNGTNAFETRNKPVFIVDSWARRMLAETDEGVMSWAIEPFGSDAQNHGDWREIDSAVFDYESNIIYGTGFHGIHVWPIPSYDGSDDASNRFDEPSATMTRPDFWTYEPVSGIGVSPSDSRLYLVNYQGELAFANFTSNAPIPFSGCLRGYYGASCENRCACDTVEQCNDGLAGDGSCCIVPCLNEGVCEYLNSTWSCVCSDGFTGETCSEVVEDPIDETEGASEVENADDGLSSPFSPVVIIGAAASILVVGGVGFIALNGARGRSTSSSDEPVKEGRKPVGKAGTGKAKTGATGAAGRRRSMKSDSKQSTKSSGGNARRSTDGKPRTKSTGGGNARRSTDGKPRTKSTGGGNARRSTDGKPRTKSTGAKQGPKSTGGGNARGSNAAKPRTKSVNSNRRPKSSKNARK